MKIFIVGAGNMGVTYARAFINSHVANREEITLLTKPNDPKIGELNALQVGSVSVNYADVRHAELIILSVKPQDAAAVFEELKPHLDQDQLVLSVMAGITIKTIQDQLGVLKVVRAMPNLPAQIGRGMTAFTATEAVSRKEEQWIQNLLQTTGKTLNVESERQIDAVTAISGSGPAYVYFFMNAMIRASKEMGFTGSEAELLVKQTFSGAIDLYQQNSLSCKEWIQMVSSKGGTTEAAFNCFNDFQLENNIVEGLMAAFARAEELGK